MPEWESKRQESDEQKQFRNDMGEASYPVQFYNGRFFYEGWATTIDDRSKLQEVIRATDVTLQWDELGLGLIIYPIQ